MLELYIVAILEGYDTGIGAEEVVLDFINEEPHAVGSHLSVQVVIHPCGVDSLHVGEDPVGGFLVPFADIRGGVCRAGYAVHYVGFALRNSLFVGSDSKH